MVAVKEKDLNRIGFVATLGLFALLAFIFWLKGHNFRKDKVFTFYFENVNGLEEGSALRWHGLKIGLVKSINPVRKNIELDEYPAQTIADLGNKHLEEGKALLKKPNINDLVFAREKINQAQLELALAKLATKQHKIKKGKHIKIEAIVTTKDVPIGKINQVTIVPSGLIGEQYVDLSSIKIDKEFSDKFNYPEPRFISLEPIRLDSLIRVNLESSEAIKNLANRVNAIFTQKDAENIKEIIKGANEILSDDQLVNNLRESVVNIKEITNDFSIWKFIFSSKKDRD